MMRLAMLFVFLFVSLGVGQGSFAAGLIISLPEDGTWALYDVETTINHKDGTVTESIGTLTVRSVGKVTIDGVECRWLEFELSWEEAITEENSRKFHSSIRKIAIDNLYSPRIPIQKTRYWRAFLEKHRQRKNQINGPTLEISEITPGRGSRSGYAVLDQYLRAPFDNPKDLGGKMMKLNGKEHYCVGIEKSETNHKLGAPKTSIESTAFRRWECGELRCDEIPFGTMQYHFDKIQIDGIRFKQRLTLRATGKGAKSSIPDESTEK